MAKIPSPHDDRAGWLDWRRGGICGTDAAAIVGKSRYKTRRDVYLEKIAAAPTQQETLIMQRGLAMEPLVAKRFCAETGRTVRYQPPKEHNSIPVFRCTTDYQVLAAGDGKGENATGLLECKTANRQAFRKIALDGLPEDYYLQVQHNLFVHQYLFGHVAVLCPDTWEFVTYPVRLDVGVIDWLTAECRRFWDEHVIPRIPPDFGGTDQPPAPDLPEIGGELVRIDSPEFADAVDAFNYSSQLLGEAKELHEQAKEKIQKVMTDHNTDVIAGASKIFYWREQRGRVSFDKKALLAAHPEIDISAFEKRGKPFRVFKPYDFKEAQSDE